MRRWICRSKAFDCCVQRSSSPASASSRAVAASIFLVVAAALSSSACAGVRQWAGAGHNRRHGQPGGIRWGCVEARS